MNASIIENIAKSVLPYAPSVASSLLGAPGGLIVSLLEHLFGVDADKLPDTISADPAAREKLQELANQHQEILEHYALQQFQSVVDDRKSARDREEKIIQLTGKRDWMLDGIAVLVILGFFILCIINYFVKIPDDHVITMLIGQISSGFMLCLSYYFGSSNK